MEHHFPFERGIKKSSAISQEEIFHMFERKNIEFGSNVFSSWPNDILLPF